MKSTNVPAVVPLVAAAACGRAQEVKGIRLIGRIVGIALPDGLNRPPAEEGDTWERAATDKYAIRDQLDKSFAYVRKGTASMPDSSLEKMVDLFGPKVSTRTLLMILLTHVHEHLGQSIACARTAGRDPNVSDLSLVSRGNRDRNRCAGIAPSTAPRSGRSSRVPLT